MKQILSILALTLLTLPVFAQVQDLGECTYLKKKDPIFTNATVEVVVKEATEKKTLVRPGRWETITVVPEKTYEIIVQQARDTVIFEKIEIEEPYIKWVKSNCGSEQGCSWKKVLVPAKTTTVRKVKQLPARTRFVTTPAVTAKEYFPAVYKTTQTPAQTRLVQVRKTVANGDLIKVNCDN